MKNKLSRFYFLKKLSLVQQLIVVLSFVGLLLVAVMMPLVDYNLSSIIDQQMYETLSMSQYAYFDGYMPNSGQDKPTFHIVYDSSSNAFITTNIKPKQAVLVMIFIFISISLFPLYYILKNDGLENINVKD